MLKSWHRTIGLMASVFLLLLTLTGLALMQTDALDLDSRTIANERMLNWYGVRPAPPPLSFASGDHRLTQLGDRLYFDDRFVASIESPLIGVVPANGEILASTGGGMIVLTGNGDIAERLEVLDANAPVIRQIGIDDEGAIVVRGAGEARRYDVALGSFSDGAVVPPIRWSLESSAPAELMQTLKRNYRGSGLSLERVLLDLHTGRLFGSLGVLIVNTASVMLLVLVISGFILWIGRMR